MNLVISGKQLELTHFMKEMVAEHLLFLEDKLPGDKTVTVTFEAKPVQKATILFYHEQEVINLSESGEDLYDVFPKLAKKVEKRMRTFKEMKNAFNKRRNEVENETPMAHDELEEVEPAVTKRKRFEMKPMFEAEAILQMMALGHPQFIFANAELDGRICLLYTRKDKTFGVIEATI